MAEETSSSQEQLLRQITSRAAVDGEFRTRLLTEPHSAVAEAVGIELPATFRIRFVERDSDLDALVVLPELIPEAAELSEEELEAVAGGSDWQVCLGNSAQININ
jgi:hypothetical protein